MLLLQIIGGGSMGEALVKGLLKAGWATAPEIGVVEVSETRRSVLSALGVDISSEPFDSAPTLLAVKPDDIPQTAALLKGRDANPVISIAAGVSISSLESLLPQDTRVLRAMPNTPASVGEAMTALSPGGKAQDADISWAEGILKCLGKVKVLDEKYMDAITALSGSGPAYLFFLAEALTEAGIEAGLDAETADFLTRQTLLGSSRLLADSPDAPADLRNMVTSPGGTTAAAMEVLEQAGLKEIFKNAVAAAKARSKELGQHQSG